MSSDKTLTPAEKKLALELRAVTVAEIAEHVRTHAGGTYAQYRDLLNEVADDIEQKFGNS